MIDDEGLSRQTYRYLYYLFLAFSICLLFAFWWMRVQYQQEVQRGNRAGLSRLCS